MKKLLQALGALVLPLVFFYFAAHSLMKGSQTPVAIQTPEAALAPEATPPTAVAVETPQAPVASNKVEVATELPKTKLADMPASAPVAAAVKAPLIAKPEKVTQLSLAEGRAQSDKVQSEKSETVKLEKIANTKAVEKSSTKKLSKKAQRLADKKEKALAKKRLRDEAKLAARKSSEAKLAARKIAQSKLARDHSAKVRKSREDQALQSAEQNEYLAARDARHGRAKDPTADVKKHDPMPEQEDENALVINQVSMSISEDTDEAVKKQARSSPSDSSFDAAIYQ